MSYYNASTVKYSRAQLQWGLCDRRCRLRLPVVARDHSALLEGARLLCHLATLCRAGARRTCVQVKGNCPDGHVVPGDRTKVYLGLIVSLLVGVIFAELWSKFFAPCLHFEAFRGLWTGESLILDMPWQKPAWICLEPWCLQMSLGCEDVFSAQMQAMEKIMGFLRIDKAQAWKKTETQIYSIYIDIFPFCLCFWSKAQGWKCTSHSEHNDKLLCS